MATNMRPFFQGLGFEVVFFQPPKVSTQETRVEPNDSTSSASRFGHEDGVKAS